VGNRQGDIAEAKFQVAALERGYTVSIPTKSSSYDFILDTGTRTVKVQVKSTVFKRKGAYRLRVTCGGKKNRHYAADQVDFIVGYVHPENAWYIVPLEAIESTDLPLYPHRASSGKYERFRDAWNLLE